MLEEGLFQVPIIYKSLRKDFSIELNVIDMSASSLVYVLNYLGIKTRVCSGGRYKEHALAFDYPYKIDNPSLVLPWITFSFPPNNSYKYAEGIEQIASENLWEIKEELIRGRKHLADDIHFILRPNSEFFQDVPLKKEYIQQTQKEMITLAFTILEIYGNSRRKGEIADEINEHRERLYNEISFFNKMLN